MRLLLYIMQPFQKCHFKREANTATRTASEQVSSGHVPSSRVIKLMKMTGFLLETLENNAHVISKKNLLSNVNSSV